jgi:hypothetical protein
MQVLKLLPSCCIKDSLCRQTLALTEASSSTKLTLRSYQLLQLPPAAQTEQYCSVLVLAHTAVLLPQTPINLLAWNRDPTSASAVYCNHQHPIVVRQTELAGLLMARWTIHQPPNQPNNCG